MLSVSERKTTEIKLRVTPAEKTAWQIAAEEEGIALSELVRREMNKLERRAAWNYQIPVVVSDSVPPGFLVIKNITDAQGVALDAQGEDSPVAPSCDCHEHEHQVCDVCQRVSTFGAENSVRKPWMFEARDRD